MNPHELIGRSYVDMDNGFGELYCELKVLDMKTEDGFIKRRKKEGSAIVIRGGVQCPAVAKRNLKISPKWQNFAI